MSIAAAGPSIRAMRWVPLPPGRIPSFVSSRPIRHRPLSAIRMSHAIDSSNPPPMVSPVIPTTTGFGSPRNSSRKSW